MYESVGWKPTCSIRDSKLVVSVPASPKVHHIMFINLIFTWQSDTYANAKAAEAGKVSWISANKTSRQHGEQRRNLVAAQERERQTDALRAKKRVKLPDHNVCLGPQRRNPVVAQEQATMGEPKRHTDVLAKRFKRPDNNVCHGPPFQTPRTSGAAGSDSAARGINTPEQLQYDCDM
jgi:hypothetical protein